MVQNWKYAKWYVLHKNTNWKLKHATLWSHYFILNIEKKKVDLVLYKNVTLQMEGQVERVASWDTALI